MILLIDIVLNFISAVVVIYVYLYSKTPLKGERERESELIDLNFYDFSRRES